MQPVFAYLIKMILCSAILLGYYWLALRNERFHQWNRFYLMAAMLLSIMVPFFHLPIVAQEEPTVVVTMVAALPWNDVAVQDTFQFDWKDAIALAAMIVSSAMLLHLAFSIFKVVRLYRIHQPTRLNDVSLVVTNEQTAPFSFFKWLFWRNDIDPDSENGKRMLQHELTHISEKHSTDKLFTELVLIVFWMNPFFWILRKELFAIHEFLADQKAIQQYDGAAFAAMILQAVNPSSTPALSNPFFTSQLKRRLVMITTSRAPKYSYLRRISGFVLMVTTTLLLILTIEKVQAQKTPKPDKPAKLAAPVPDAPTPPPAPAKQLLPDSIKSIQVWDNNGDCMFTYKMKDGRAVKMKMTDAKKNGYPLVVPPPPPPAPPAAASGLAPVAPDQPTVPAATVVAADGTKITADGIVINSDGEMLKSLNVNTNGADPLYIYAGLIISKEQMQQIDPNNIYKIDVLKGDAAIKAYGDKGKNGVVKITPKNTDYSLDNGKKTRDYGEVVVVGYGSKSPGPSSQTIVRGANTEKPLYIVDGKKISDAEMKELKGEQIKTMNVLKGEAATNKYGDEAKDGVIEIRLKDPKEPKDDKGPKDIMLSEVVFTKAEEMPSFPGGQDGWRKYLERSLNYPATALFNGTQGVAKVKFKVEPDGSLKDFVIMQNPGDGLGEEALRIIKAGPKWNPAIQNGHKVLAEVNQTVTFRLE